MIKKMMVTLIVTTLLVGMAAYTPSLANDDSGKANAKHEMMMKYRDQWKKLNQLEQEYLSYKIEALKLKNKAIDLYADTKGMEKLKKMKNAAQMKEQWKQHSEQLKESKAKVCEQRENFYQALKENNDQAAKEALQKWIEAKQERNKIFKKKLVLSEKMLKSRK